MAKATFDILFPASGDAFSVANFKNEFQALYQGDVAPLRPKAHGTPDMGIMIYSSVVDSYYSQCYASGDFPLNVPSGNVTFVAPSVNPRIDLVYCSGDRFWSVTGAEAASPTIPRFPSGDSCIPIVLVYHNTTETKIVNYENKDANPTHGYLYRDVRPRIVSWNTY